MASDSPQIPYDLDFLLRAANYSGGPDAPHSEAARKAVDVIAERYRTIADLQLRVAQEQVRGKDPAAMAAEEEDRTEYVLDPRFAVSIRTP